MYNAKFDIGWKERLMNIEEFLRGAAAQPGVTGMEMAAAEYIAEAFRPYVDDVHITPVASVIAHRKGKGPKVMLAAHLDEIGMVVSKIEEDGALRMQTVGGVDPRIMPGMRVRVYGKKQLMGVVGATPPHLLSQKDRGSNYNFQDTLFVDLGMPADKVKKLVNVGDMVCFENRFTELKNGRYSMKTADDRACVAILIKAAELLKDMKCDADVYFVATCQEEVGSHGAWTAGYEIDPDYGIALDVCHAVTPGAPAARTHAIENLVITKCPFTHPFLVKKMEEVAREQNVTLQTAISPRGTATDNDRLSLVRGGVPSVLLSLPLKYMHTNVETFDMHALTEGARLLAHYLRAVDHTWEEQLWN